MKRNPPTPIATPPARSPGATDTPAHDDAARRVRPCRECGKRFEPKRDDQAFCHPSHKRAWWSRAQKRGGVVYPLLIQWRISRGTDKSASLSDICEILDLFIAEDRRLGRAMVNGTTPSRRHEKYVDRRRPGAQRKGPTS